ncbi:MAG: hypothetical protein ACFE95_06475 [Candidatus Hodarchaeota archaeon]
MLKDKNQGGSCPGIGKQGKPLKNSIKDCIVFLENLKDSPNLLATIILENDAFNKIRNDRWLIEQ